MRNFSTNCDSSVDLSIHLQDSSESNNAFNEILITPELKTKKIMIARKKVLNYRAQ